MINADNGPENSGSRSQWLKRLVQFSARFQVKLQLAYYLPYHSKYNPIERVFGVLENYWNGDPLRTVEKALGMAEGMTYNKVHPVVRMVEQCYKKGVRLSRKQRQLCETALNRQAGLKKWFLTIEPERAKQVYALLN